MYTWNYFFVYLINKHNYRQIIFLHVFCFFFDFRIIIILFICILHLNLKHQKKKCVIFYGPMHCGWSFCRLTHRGATHENDYEGAKDSSNPNHPRHPQEKNNPKNILDTWQVDSHQSAQLWCLKKETKGQTHKIDLKFLFIKTLSDSHLLETKEFQCCSSVQEPNFRVCGLFCDSEVNSYLFVLLTVSFWHELGFLLHMSVFKGQYDVRFLSIPPPTEPTVPLSGGPR